MAKQKKEHSSGGGETRAFIFAGIMLAVFTFVFSGLAMYSAMQSRTINSSSAQARSLLNTMNDELRKVNENVLEIVGGVGDAAQNVAEITISFDAIEGAEKAYVNTDYLGDAELRRFNQAKTFMTAYRTRLNDFQVMLNRGELDRTTMIALYTQEIAPIAFTSSEMLEAAIALNTNNVSALTARVRQISQFSNLITGLFFIVGEIGIVIAARIAKRRREEIEKRTKQAEAAANKFKHSQQKQQEIAFTNILTNLPNRYKLDGDLEPRLDNETFNIALFDMDNFKIINDTYGYDFGDEYLAQIAERLKTEYSQYAEIYNVMGNSFAFVFNKDVSDVQATRLAQNILMSMSDVYTVANLAIQLTCSGCIYHYIAGDAQNLSGLLVKMDNEIRNVKRGGGNAVVKVDSI